MASGEVALGESGVTRKNVTSAKEYIAYRYNLRPVLVAVAQISKMLSRREKSAQRYGRMADRMKQSNIM
jgi:hypothetical protein